MPLQRKEVRKKKNLNLGSWRELDIYLKIRDKLYKQFIKSKNNQTHEIKQAAFKKYQNKTFE